MMHSQENCRWQHDSLNNNCSNVRIKSHFCHRLMLSEPFSIRWELRDRFGFWLFCSMFYCSHTSTVREKTKRNKWSCKCVYSVPYDVSIVNFTALSDAHTQKRWERGKKRQINTQRNCWKSFEVGDKSCLKSVFEQNETNFLRLFVQFASSSLLPRDLDTNGKVLTFEYVVAWEKYSE